MELILSQFKELKKKYDDGESPVKDLKDITILCLKKLNMECEIFDYGVTTGKNYIVYADAVSKNKSRPINKKLYINDLDQFSRIWDDFFSTIDQKNHVSELQPVSDINKIIYTSIISFSSAVDIWKNGSRKTPGTYFEILLGSILSQFLPEFTRSKFIRLPGQEEKVSTDIVFEHGDIGLVIPAKITTRERIVQPYAHQRILDSIFGVGKYKSILMCVSETQRDDKKIAVNDICVPGTVKLFQAHLSSLSGLYYIDPPLRYLRDDIANLISVGDYAALLTSDLHKLTL